MAKYRKLTLEELNEFEKEFIDYLVVNGITADKWVEIKKKDIEKASQIVDLFSDVVFEGILRKVQFLELRSPNYISAIQCLEAKMINVAITSEIGGLSIDLSEDLSNSLKIHRLEKYYKNSREMDLFELLEKGYQISHGDLFKNLLLASVKDD